MPTAKKPVQPKGSGGLVFIHAADLQLGKSFSSIPDEAKRARVQQERFEAVRRIGEVVRDRGARFVVLAGDVFDSPTPTHATISTALGAFTAIGAPIYAIPGNHDHAGPDSVWETAFFRRERERIAPHLHVLDSATATVVNLGHGRAGPDSVVLLPCPLLRRHHAEDPTAWIRNFDFSSVGDGPRIVIAHGSTAVFTSVLQIDEDGETIQPANTIAIDRLPLEEIDYCAIGDWHSFAAAGPKSFYSGTPETDRFPKIGQQPGHVACVTVGRGVQPTVDAVRTGRFRWLSHSIALETVPGPESVANAGGPSYLDAWLTEATHPKEAGEPGFDGSLARITVTGTVSLAGRQELDRIIESWQARLLRLDLVDTVRIAPTVDEIHDLAARPGDPIISRVAAELVRRLEEGGPQTEIDVIRHAIFTLHALTTPETNLRVDEIPRASPTKTQL
jgi:DNA repair exonuclease SbcCD nuclease subunit